MKRWVVVANATRAIVYGIEAEQKLSKIHDIANPEGHLRNQDLVSDRPGRNFESAGATRHGYESADTPKEVEHDAFSRSLLEFLEKHAESGDFDRVYLAASPSFLGHLRNHASKKLRSYVHSEVDKDLTHTDESKLLDYFIF